MSINDFFTTTTQTIPGLLWIYNIDTLKVFTPSMERLTTRGSKTILVYQYDLHLINKPNLKMQFDIILN